MCVSGTVGNGGTEVRDEKSSVSDKLRFVRVFSKTTHLTHLIFSSFFPHQETIEVESENVFKLAAFALQVRVRGFSTHSHILSLVVFRNVNEDVGHTDATVVSRDHLGRSCCQRT